MSSCQYLIVSVHLPVDGTTDEQPIMIKFNVVSYAYCTFLLLFLCYYYIAIIILAIIISTEECNAYKQWPILKIIHTFLILDFLTQI